MELRIIPQYPLYKAGEDGEIYLNGSKCNSYRNGDKYHTVSVRREGEKFTTLGKHRLVAMAWKPKEEIDDLIVNHRDKDKDNNRPPNVEWVTVEENNIHDSITTLNPKKPRLVIDDNKGHRWLEDNVYTAGDKLGLEPLTIWDAVRDDVDIDGYTITHQRAKSPLPSDLRKPTGMSVGHDIKSVGVKLLNLRTGKIIEYSSMYAAAKDFNVSASHIHQSISSELNKSFKGEYLVAREVEQFPSLTKEDIEEILNRGTKEVLAFRPEDNRVTIFSSASQFYNTENISKKAVATRLKAGRLSPVSGWWFCYRNKLDVIDKLNEFINYGVQPE